MESGILLEPDVVELLRQFDSLEIFTDNKYEREYAAVQRRVTGYNANPTYIVLDSENHREVTRTTFTNSKEEFLDFLKDGLRNTPAFASSLEFQELVPLDGQLDDTVAFATATPLEADAGTAVEIYGDKSMAYEGGFRARQSIQLPAELPAGAYRVEAKLITSVYVDGEWQESLSIPARMRLVIE